MYNNSYHTTDLRDTAFLITGGAGFIGSNLVRYLLAHGAAKVRVLDNLSTGSLSNLQQFISDPAFEFTEGDIRDLETCKQSCRGIHYVSHLAALGSVPRSIHDPLSTNQVNIDGFLNMLMAAKDENVKRMVYAASSSTYGDSKELPKQEDKIGNPLSPYAVTKLVNELYADVFRKTYGTDSIGLRYFNVFGPNQDPGGAYAAVIPLFIQAVLSGQPAMINGDGSQTRDFTFIENVIQANVKAMLYPAPLPHTIYNVACGERISLNGIWALLKELAGTDPGQTFRPSRTGDIHDSLADISRIKTDLGYQPLFSVREGIKLTLDWTKNKL
ncbi:UDP-N-acetylglucosamine 4-epimerase [Pedobacter westerhofensis]|uniref:UDP-N-acetylglucosamine 4-epimerase n=1 Tax=Pedobacter westerhofensis TaxID=425512 RepID=A0A521FJH6_9SPHI|nr:SDR family oxidoreductase [Pedobacter westerhofensis]SMO96382.1 UDP-N-acetylglucosamine 4-epimerase [Pedobacter westerhofensis]